MKTSHTPGPLFVGRFSEGDYNVTDADGGNVLASGIQKIEDAKLFAAAPDLMEALKKAEDMLYILEGRAKTTSSEEDQEIAELFKSIESAIKKATE